MKKLIIVLIICWFSYANIAAQSLKVIKATKQDWSGGVAGHYGTNYSITLSPASKSIILDSIYVGGVAEKLIPGAEGNVKLDSTKRTCTIFTEESHYEESVPIPGDKPSDVPIMTQRHFNGAALILYKYKGKECALLIKRFQELPPIDYP
jgi:hypothetical protein